MAPSGTKRKASTPAENSTTAKKAKAAPAPRKSAVRGAAPTKITKDDTAATEKAAPKKAAAMPAKKATATKAAPKKTAPKKAAPKKAPAKAAEKKTATAKTTQKKATTTEPATTEKSVKTEEDQDEEPTPAPAPAPAKAKPAPKRKAAEAAAPAEPKKVKLGPKINEAPKDRLDIYVFGEGSAGELGLGSKKVDGKSPVDVKRPRLNNNLNASTVGVVQISTGGMHCAALTHDNKILTWGVNDQGALGRDTKWDGGLRDIDDDEDDSDDDDDDTGMNPLESTPTAIDNDHFPEGTRFVQVVASDSATFTVTEDGSVYGWGTFRSNDGILGFTKDINIQYVPYKIPELKNIKYLAAGANHILALNNKGNVFAWGSGQQNQLGRRIVERTRAGGLVPREFGLPKNKIDKISCGAYHAFAIDKKGQVWAWGLNNFCETGIVEGAGDDNAVIPKPEVVKALKDYNISEICGGGHHSLACTTDGKVLAWGRADGAQIGVKIEDIPKDLMITDERDAPRILSEPFALPLTNISIVAAASDTSIAIDNDGKAYSWGFSANYQTGQGTDEDVEVATLIDNTAIRGKKLIGAGAGGQFGLLYAKAAIAN